MDALTPDQRQRAVRLDPVGFDGHTAGFVHDLIGERAADRGFRQLRARLVAAVGDASGDRFHF